VEEYKTLLNLLPTKPMMQVPLYGHIWY